MKPDLKEINKLLLSGKNFSLTESQYFKSTGLNIPKSKYYLKNKSAVYKDAEKYGYVIELQEKTLIFKKRS